jgi:hypothetical protein
MRILTVFLWVTTVWMGCGIYGMASTASHIGDHCPDHAAWSPRYIASRIISGPSSIVSAYRDDGCVKN